MKELKIESCRTEKLDQFELISEKTLTRSSKGGKQQVLINDATELTASHLKFTISSGFDDFVAVYKLAVMGHLASVISDHSPQATTSAASVSHYPTSNNYYDEADVDDEEEEEQPPKEPGHSFKSAFRLPSSKRTLNSSANSYEGTNGKRIRDDSIAPGFHIRDEDVDSLAAGANSSSDDEDVPLQPSYLQGAPASPPTPPPMPYF